MQVRLGGFFLLQTEQDRQSINSEMRLRIPSLC